MIVKRYKKWMIRKCVSRMSSSGRCRTSYPSVLCRFPANDDAGIAGNIRDAGVKKGAVRRRHEHRRLLAARLPSLHGEFHAACAEGAAPQPTDDGLKTSTTQIPSQPAHQISYILLYALIKHLIRDPAIKLIYLEGKIRLKTTRFNMVNQIFTSECITL